MLTTLTRRVPRPSVALVVAFVALFAALGGTGYAALKVTGKNIQNGTVTGDDIKNKSLKEKELEPDTITGSRIKESALGTVPGAQHAATADSATNAQNAAKASDADAVGGIPASQLMTQKTRAYESTISAVNNFPNGSTLGSIPNLPGGTYLVTARLNYYNPGAAGTETCTLQVPSTDDTSEFAIASTETETVTLQEVVSTGSTFMPTVSCTSDGSDDLDGNGSLIAIRLD